MTRPIVCGGSVRRRTPKCPEPRRIVRTRRVVRRSRPHDRDAHGMRADARCPDRFRRTPARPPPRPLYAGTADPSTVTATRASGGAATRIASVSPCTGASGDTCSASAPVCDTAAPAGAPDAATATRTAQARARVQRRIARRSSLPHRVTSHRWPSATQAAARRRVRKRRVRAWSRKGLHDRRPRCARAAVDAGMPPAAGAYT